MKAPPIVHAILRAFTERYPELLDMAMKEPGQTSVHVFFDAEGYVVDAHFNTHERHCSQLVATPHEEPMEGEPAVGFVITPGNREGWAG